MPRLNEIFPSQFLKAADLNGRQVKVVIDRVVNEKVGDDLRWVAYFQNAEKGLVLNKTNADTIAMIVGDDDTDNWAGHPIVLFPTMTQYQGRPVEAIRVTRVLRQGGSSGQAPAGQASTNQITSGHQPQPTAQPQQRQPMPANTGEMIDDEIPF